MNRCWILVRDNFTVFGVATISIISVLTAVVVMLLAVRIYKLENIPAHAVTTEERAGCANMPRGSQVMENNRFACFKELYGEGAWATKF